MPAHLAGSVTVKVVSLGIAGSGTYTYNPGPALLFPAPPGGEVNVAYSDQLTVTGGTSPYTWSVSAGTLPPGLTLGASTGLLSGTPTTAGTYSFTVKVTDHCGLSDTEPVSMTIIAGPSLNFPAPPPGWTHTVYGDTLTESGGTAPFTWSVSSGSLPAGISLSADGNLSGTPTATGTFSFTVQVTDANSQSATEATSITVSARGLDDVRRPAGGGRRHRLHRHPHRHRRHHSLHLVGERGEPATRHHPHLRGRTGGHPHHRGQLPLHGQRDRREQRHRHHLDHAGGRRHPVA